MTACSGAATSTTANSNANDAGFIVASWSTGRVTAPEVDAAAKKLPPALREQFLTPSGKRELVHTVVTKRLLFEEAKRQNINQRSEIATQVRELEERLSIQALVDEQQREAPQPTEAELQAYYEGHRDEFKTPARVRVARLQLNGDAHDKKLRARLESLHRRLVKGEALAEVALDADGPERLRAGEVGWVTTPENAQSTAALALKTPNEISPIVEGPTTVALIVLLEREEARVPEFAEARPTVASRFAPVRQRKVFDALVAKLTADAHVQFTDGGVL